MKKILDLNNNFCISCHFELIIARLHVISYLYNLLKFINKSFFKNFGKKVELLFDTLKALKSPNQNSSGLWMLSL